jgi:hypothetical protein
MLLGLVLESHGGRSWKRSHIVKDAERRKGQMMKSMGE